MNLLLLDANELAADGTCTVGDRRALHLRTVLGVEIGQKVRAGVTGGAIGSADVLALDGDGVTVRFTATGPASAPMPLDLVLALPRPKVITRTIEIASSFGVRRIELTNAWRVDKSYLRSPRVAPDALAYASRFGAEQGATTHVSPVTVHERLMALLDSRFSAPSPSELRLVAHPGAPPIENVITTDAASYVLAIGPEGGWIDRELETLTERGFHAISLGAPILRVEAAVASALGQLSLVRRLRAVTS